MVPFHATKCLKLFIFVQSNCRQWLRSHSFYVGVGSCCPHSSHCFSLLHFWNLQENATKTKFWNYFPWGDSWTIYAFNKCWCDLSFFKFRFCMRMKHCANCGPQFSKRRFFFFYYEENTFLSNFKIWDFSTKKARNSGRLHNMILASSTCY